MKSLRCVLFLLVVVSSWSFQSTANAATPPNIVLIYGDDVGYGDVGCYGAKTIPTPNIDRLADNGLRFTSGYCTSATCTPSRYSMLTGEYAWRKKGTGIAPPNGTALIKPGRVTLASLLKEAGYATAVIGKWHLGLGEKPKPNWSGVIKPGPLEIGFDYCYMLPTTNDRVPCVYLENHRIVGHDSADPVDVFKKNPDDQPTGISERASLKMDWSHGHNDSIVNGISRIGFMVGGNDIRWVDEEMSDKFVGKAKEFIHQNKDQPFFLFYSSEDIHVPRAPDERFVGATPHGPRGDAMVEFDDTVGALMEILEEAGVADNTLVVISSDNGPVLDDGYKDDAREKLGDHQPAGPFRGGKYSNFEGGTRVPFVTYWPGRIKPGVSDAFVSQVDFPATFARIAGYEGDLSADAIPDSLDMTAALLGDSSEGREYMVQHAGSLSIRVGPWKYIAPSNNWKINKNTGTELGNSVDPQLYNLDDDPGEKKNLAMKNPRKTIELEKLLESVRNAKRTRP